MADLALTACAPTDANTRMISGVVGEAGGVTLGDTLYKLAADAKYYLADADAVATAKVVGMCCLAASLNAATIIAIGGNVTTDNVGTTGTTFYQSHNAGQICLRSDLDAGAAYYVTLVGTYSTGTVLALGIRATGIAAP